MFSLRKNISAGLLAAIPLWVTWLVIAFILGLVIDLVGPIGDWLVAHSRSTFPLFADVLELKAVRYLISIVLLLGVLYLLGWLTTHFIGRRLLQYLDKVLEKIPFAGKIYSGTKQVLEAFKSKPDHAEQVVLIEYPHPGMKTIGIVTKTMTDSKTKQPLLAVYVPTTPNPTSGFLEIVPAERAVATDWSVNDAISFVVSGGSVGPTAIDFTLPSSELSKN
ncbi:MAG: DUF502 domain-containing protein [Candidatus Zixiibacteriota bacterium]